MVSGLGQRDLRQKLYKLELGDRENHENVVLPFTPPGIDRKLGEGFGLNQGMKLGTNPSYLEFLGEDDPKRHWVQWH